MDESSFPDEIDKVREIAADFLEKIGIPGGVNVTKGDDQLLISLETGKTDGLLIGKRGGTLDAIEHLLRRIIFKKTGYAGRIIVDIAGYKERREKWLVDLAQSLAEKVSATGEPQMTELLTARERRIIHVTLKDNPSVKTEAPGEDTIKRVRIIPSQETPRPPESF